MGGARRVIDQSGRLGFGASGARDIVAAQEQDEVGIGVGMARDFFGGHGRHQFSEGESARFPAAGVVAEELSVRHERGASHD